MGSVSEGVYTQPDRYFSCPLQAEPIGLNGTPTITDAYRITRTEFVPLSERSPGDWQNNKILSDEIRPSRIVKFEDASGTVIEISSGRRTHATDMDLKSDMSRSWRFAKQEMELLSGQSVMPLKMSLELVPWHKDGMVYVGVDVAESYRQGQGPDPQLWVKSHLVFEDVLHSINIQLPAASYVSKGVPLRDLPAIRDDISARPDLQKELLAASYAWLERCRFSEVIE